MRYFAPFSELTREENALISRARAAGFSIFYSQPGQARKTFLGAQRFLDFLEVTANPDIIGCLTAKDSTGNDGNNT